MATAQAASGGGSADDIARFTTHAIGTAERRVYYRPSPHGEEAEIGPRLRQWWGDAPYDTEEWWEFKKFRDPDR